MTLICRTDDGEDGSPSYSPFDCVERDRAAARATLNWLIPNTPVANQVPQYRRDFIFQRLISLHWTRFGAWKKNWGARHRKSSWTWKAQNFTLLTLFTSPWFIFEISAAEEMYRGSFGPPVLVPFFPAYRRAQERWASRGWWERGDADPS